MIISIVALIIVLSVACTQATVVALENAACSKADIEHKGNLFHHEHRVADWNNCTTKNALIILGVPLVVLTVDMMFIIAGAIRVIAACDVSLLLIIGITSIITVIIFHNNEIKSFKKICKEIDKSKKAYGTSNTIYVYATKAFCTRPVNRCLLTTRDLRITDISGEFICVVRKYGNIIMMSEHDEADWQHKIIAYV